LLAITPVKVISALMIALAIAFAIEFAQAFHMLDALGLHNNRIARVVLGGFFDTKDLLCYVADAGVMAVIEGVRTRTFSPRA
jgi:hypothetical protein